GCYIRSWCCNLSICPCSSFLSLDLETCFVSRVISPGENDCVCVGGSDRKPRWRVGNVIKSCGILFIGISGGRNRVVRSHSIVIFSCFIETSIAVGSYIRTNGGNFSVI